jgi:hypothetical protein
MVLDLYLPIAERGRPGRAPMTERSRVRSEQEAYDRLCADTLSRHDVEFIHQHVVDAYAAQNADESTKPIGLTFALVGLYLHVEKGWTGRQVQRAHMTLARRRRRWPTLLLPRDRGALTASEVVRAPEGPERDRAIHGWCRSVWESFAESRGAVVEVLRQGGIL